MGVTWNSDDGAVLLSNSALLSPSRGPRNLGGHGLLFSDHNPHPNTHDFTASLQYSTANPKPCPRAGKYSLGEGGVLPPGPRGALFRQLLPEVAPLLEVLDQVARGRGKTPSQVGVVRWRGVDVATGVVC